MKRQPTQKPKSNFEGRAWLMIAPFAELVRLSRTRIADEMRIGHPTVAHDKAGVLFVNRPGRREASRRHCGIPARLDWTGGHGTEP